MRYDTARASGPACVALALSFLVAGISVAQTPKWGVPLDERRVVLTESGDGDARRIVVENGFLRAVIAPARGGRVESLVHKRTGQEMTLLRTETQPGGLLSDQVWQQNYWHGDWNDAPYEAVVVSRPPQSDRAQVRLTGKGRLWAGIVISKTLTVLPDRSAIQVEYEMTSDKTADKRLRPDFWFHNTVAGPGRSFMPSPAGVLTRPLATEDETWVYEPTRGWHAFLSDKGAGIAATMEFKRLRGLHACHTPVNTVEWVWRHVMAEDLRVVSPVQLGLFSGLKEVSGAGDDAVVDMTLGEAAQGSAAARVRIAALADLDATLTLTVARLDGPRPADQPAKAVTREVKLKADSAADFDLSVPVAGNGSFVVCGVLTRGDKALVSFERELTVGTPSGTYAMTPEGPREPDRGRRTYIPLNFDFSSLAHETPHVKWAKPYAGGRPRVLALLPMRCEREAVELAQRFDMDLSCSLLAKADGLTWLLGDGIYNVKKEHLDAHLEKMLAREYDAIIVGESWDLLTPKARDRVVAMVEKGAGLLFVGVAPPDLKDKLPLEPAKGIQPGKWGLPADAVVTAALPLAAMPPAHASPCAMKPAPDDLQDREPPQSLLMAGKAVIAGAGPCGKGRIVQLTTSGPLVFRSDRSYETHPFDYWEYQYALLGRLLYYAAGKQSGVDLLAVECAPAQVSVRLRSKAEGPAKVYVRLRDRFGSVLDERAMDVVLKKADMAPLSLAPPAAVASAYHLADVTVSNAAGTLAWGAGVVLDRKVRFEKWTPDKVGFQPGEKITLTAAFQGDLPANAKVRGELWDGAGRRVVVAEVPATRPETKVVLPVERLTTTIFEARGALVGEAGVLDQAVCEAWVKLPRRRDRFEAFFWGYPPIASTPSYMVYDYYRRFRDIGMTTNWGDKYPEAHAWAFERLGMSFEVPSTGMSWGGVTKEQAAKEPDKAVGGIGDPAIDQAHRASGERRARTWAHRDVFAYGCADENRDPPPDVCFCKTCLAAFRKWLQDTQYKTVEDLNREWKTDFKTWDEVTPMTQAEAREHGGKTGCYGAWADQRQFNKWSYANHARSFVQGVLSVDPDALVGDSGTQESFATGARDYSLLAPAYTAMSAYGGTQTPEQDGMAPNLIRFMWSGYNKSGPRAKNQNWMVLGGNNYGFGIFVSGTYIDLDWTLPTDGRDLQTAIREMRSGAGQMIVSARKAWDPVYVLQSMPSLHGAYIINQDAVHKESIGGFMGLMADLAVNYRAISGVMVGQGHLRKSGARVLVLPHMVALSEAECREMREWVEEGGTLIADVSPGVMTEHCRVLPKGQLDDLFGVDRSQAALKEGPAPADKPKQKELWNLRPAGAAAAADAAAWPCSAVEVGVRGTTANPLWTAQLPGGEAVPVVFHRQAGKGHAYYLACNFSGQYAAVRGKTTKEPAQVAVLVEFQQVFEKAFAAAGVRPGAVVYRRDPATGKNGVRAPYVSVFAKDAGKVRHCMVMRDYYIHDSAPLDEPVQAVFDRKAHLYEALSGRYLGYGDSLDMTLTDYTLRIFSLLPYRVERMELRAPSGATAGSDAVISAALAVAGGPADSHWFRVEATRPDGRACEAYSANVEAKGGAAEVRIPFALNDPAGAWKVRVRDVATGVAAESRIEVKQP